MTSIAPIRKQVVVDATPEKAFKVFTDGVDRWWPREHHIGTSPLKRAIIEPREGGRWYSECQDGTECDTGKVLAWEPPKRVVLAWQITAQWQFDPAFVTEVEVNFISEGPKQTRVTLEHRNLDRYGVMAEQLRAMMDGPTAWERTLQLFGAVATGDAQAAS